MSEGEDDAFILAMAGTGLAARFAGLEGGGFFFGVVATMAGR